MRFLIVLCSTESCLDSLVAFLPLAKKRANTEMAVMDFSKIMKKDSEKQNKMTLKGVGYCGVPTHFFGMKHLNDLANVLPEEWKKKLLTDKLNSQLKERLDYGWMRNMGYLLGIASGAEAIQFFDLDTRPLDHYSKILEVHAKLLEKNNMAAVSGTYFGPRAITVQMFKSAEAQIGFLELLKEATTFDVLNPTIVGGAMAVKINFAMKYPFPMLPATTMSDDLLISYLASLINWQTQQSGEFVEHKHAFNPEHPGGLSPDWIKVYFPRLLRTTALMTIFSEREVKNAIVEAASGQNSTYKIGDVKRLEKIINAEAKLIDGLTSLARKEYDKEKKAESNKLLEIIGGLKAKSKTVCEEIDSGVYNYLELLRYWPKIVGEVQGSAFGSDWVKVS